MSGGGTRRWDRAVSAAAASARPRTFCPAPHPAQPRGSLGSLLVPRFPRVPSLPMRAGGQLGAPRPWPPGPELPLEPRVLPQPPGTRGSAVPLGRPVGRLFPAPVLSELPPCACLSADGSTGYSRTPPRGLRSPWCPPVLVTLPASLHRSLFSTHLADPLSALGFSLESLSFLCYLTLRSLS